MANQDHNLESVFKEAFASHELNHSAEVWSNVQAALPAVQAGASAAVGSAVLAKAAAIIGLTGLVVSASISEYQYHQPSPISQTTEQPHPTQKIEVQPVVYSNDALETEVHNAEGLTVKVDEVHRTASGFGSADPVANQVAKASEAGNAEAETQVTVQKPQPVSAAVAANESSTQAVQKEADQTLQAIAPAVLPKESTNQVAPDKMPEIQKSIGFFTHDAKQMISPNGDNINDVLVIEGRDIADFHLRILSQGGQVVFESKDLDVKWNGVDRFGNSLPAGVYFFEIIATGTDGLPYRESNARGSVTVVR